VGLVVEVENFAENVGPGHESNSYRFFHGGIICHRVSRAALRRSSGRAGGKDRPACRHCHAFQEGAPARSGCLIQHLFHWILSFWWDEQFRICDATDRLAMSLHGSQNYRTSSEGFGA
jgi:hypothetical protein